MPDPLPPAVHRHADEEFQLHHLEGRGVPMPHQVADQRAIVGDDAGALAVADPRGLDHRLVIAHDVHQADESIVQDGEFLPSQLLDKFGVGGHFRGSAGYDEESQDAHCSGSTAADKCGRGGDGDWGWGKARGPAFLRGFHPRQVCAAARTILTRKRKRGPQPIPSLSLRASRNRLISAAQNAGLRLPWNQSPPPNVYFRAAGVPAASVVR